jgi:hypothetical protein
VRKITLSYPRYSLKRWGFRCLCNVRYVNIIKVPLFIVALYKVTRDPFIKVASDWVSK